METTTLLETLRYRLSEEREIQDNTTNLDQLEYFTGKVRALEEVIELIEGGIED